MMNIGTLHDLLYLNWRGMLHIAGKRLPRRKDWRLRAFARAHFFGRKAGLFLFFNAGGRMEDAARFDAGGGVKNRSAFDADLGVNNLAAFEAIAAGFTNGAGASGGTGIHSAAQQPDQLEVHRCDDGGD